MTDHLDGWNDALDEAILIADNASSVEAIRATLRLLRQPNALGIRVVKSAAMPEDEVMIVGTDGRGVRMKL